MQRRTCGAVGRDGNGAGRIDGFRLCRGRGCIQVSVVVRLWRQVVGDDVFVTVLTAALFAPRVELCMQKQSIHKQETLLNMLERNKYYPT